MANMTTRLALQEKKVKASRPPRIRTHDIRKYVGGGVLLGLDPNIYVGCLGSLLPILDIPLGIYTVILGDHTIDIYTEN